MLSERRRLWRSQPLSGGDLAFPDFAKLKRIPSHEANFDLVTLLPPQGHGEDSGDPEEKKAAGVLLEAADQSRLTMPRHITKA